MFYLFGRRIGGRSDPYCIDTVLRYTGSVIVGISYSQGHWVQRVWVAALVSGGITKELKASRSPRVQLEIGSEIAFIKKPTPPAILLMGSDRC
jgi:hypothetical protein